MQIVFVMVGCWRNTSFLLVNIFLPLLARQVLLIKLKHAAKCVLAKAPPFISRIHNPAQASGVNSRWVPPSCDSDGMNAISKKWGAFVFFKEFLMR